MVKRYFRKGSQKRGKRRSYPKMSFNQRVLSVVKQTRELKYASFGAEANILQNAVGQTDILSITPPIPIGTKTFERVGNKIQLMSCKITCIYNLDNATGDASQQNGALIRHQIIRQKEIEDADQVVNQASFATNNLLENSGFYAGTLFDYMTSINKDSFSSKKTIRTKLYGVNNIQTVAGGNNQSIDGSAGLNKIISYTLRFGKNGKDITYRNSGANTPVNFPYFMMTPVHNAVHGGTYNQVDMKYLVEWKYYDA